jgi:hypothetical protein
VSGNAHLEANFSLVRGGPFYQLLDRSGLHTPIASGVDRRAPVFVLVTWVPLLILSAMQGTAFGHAVRVPFLLDIDPYVRLLFAIPVLLAAEGMVEGPTGSVIGHLAASGIVREVDRSSFESAIQVTARRRDSRLIEAVILGIVLVWAILRVRAGSPLAVTSWQVGGPAGSTWTPAGWWYVSVSLPVYHFLLLRAIWRLVIWGEFLWRLARIHLRLTPTHPDRMGGLGTLQIAQQRFAIIGFVMGADLAATIGEKILTEGATASDFQTGIITVLVIQAIVLVGPLFVFTPMLTRAKRLGLYDYGVLGARYTEAFDRRLRGRGEPKDAELLGILSAPILSTNYANIRGLRIIPLDWSTVHLMALAVALPVAPLASKYVASMDLLKRAMRILF